MDPLKYILKIFHGEEVELKEFDEVEFGSDFGGEIRFDPKKYKLDENFERGELLFALIHFYLYANNRYIYSAIIKEVLEVIISHDERVGLSLKHKLQLMLNDTIIKHLDYWLTGKFHSNPRVCPLPYDIETSDIMKVFDELCEKFENVFKSSVNKTKYTVRRKNSLIYDSMWKKLYKNMQDGKPYEELYSKIRDFYETNLMTHRDAQLKKQDQWRSYQEVIDNLKQLRLDPKMIESQINALRIDEHNKVIVILENNQK